MKTITTRKKHQCNLCWADIPKGTQCQSWVLYPNQFDNDRFETVRVHGCCLDFYESTGPYYSDGFPMDRSEWFELIGEDDVSISKCCHGMTAEELREMAE